MAKTTIGFNVSQEVADRAKELFPNGRTEDVLINLLDLYKNAGEEKPSSDNEQYREIVESICSTFTIEPQEILNLINEKNEAILTAEREIADLKDKNRRFGTENGLLIQKNQELETAQVDWDKIKSTLKPFTVLLLEKTAVKLSEKSGREVQPMQILVDMFMRYTIERWNQWFYPFQLTDVEILEAAQSVNPEISSMSEIKKTLPV